MARSKRRSCSGQVTQRSATRPSASGPPRCGHAWSIAYQPVGVLKTAIRRPATVVDAALAERDVGDVADGDRPVVEQGDGGHRAPSAGGPTSATGGCVEVAELPRVVGLVALQPRVADRRPWRAGSARAAPAPSASSKHDPCGSRRARPAARSRTGAPCTRRARGSTAAASVAIRITSSSSRRSPARRPRGRCAPAAPPMRICQPPSTATTPMSLTVASAQLRGQPDTPALTLAGVCRPSQCFSSADRRARSSRRARSGRSPRRRRS